MTISKVQLDKIFELSQKCFNSRQQYVEKYPNCSIKAGQGIQTLRSPEYKEYLSAKEALKNFLDTLDYESLLNVFALFEYGRELSHYKGIQGLLNISHALIGEEDDPIFDDDLFPIPKDSELHDAAVFLSDKSLLFPAKFIRKSIIGHKADEKEDIIRHLGRKGADVYINLKYAKEAIDYLTPNLWE